MQVPLVDRISSGIWLPGILAGAASGLPAPRYGALRVAMEFVIQIKTLSKMKCKLGNKYNKVNIGLVSGSPSEVMQNHRQRGWCCSAGGRLVHLVNHGILSPSGME